MTSQISGDEQENGNPKDGGIIGRVVLSRLESEKSFLKDLSDKLAFIASDLSCDDAWPEVAAKFINDLTEDIDEQAKYTLPEIMKDTQTLVDALVKEAPFLPDTTVEEDVIKAIVASRHKGMAHEIMSRAIIEVARVTKEHFSFPDVISLDDVAHDAVQTAVESVQKYDAAGHGEDATNA